MLLGLSKAQIAAVEATIKGNAVATDTVRQCANFLINYVFTNMKCFDFHWLGSFFRQAMPSASGQTCPATQARSVSWIRQRQKR